MTINSKELAYLMFRSSLTDYQQSPVHLEPSQLAKIEALAHRQYDLQRRVLASSEAQEVVVSSSQVNSALAEIHRYYPSEEDFQQDLNTQGIDYPSFREALCRQIQTEAVLKLVGDKATLISELDAKIYYYMHLEHFQKPERRTGRRILITINPQYPESTRRAARKRLFSIATRLRRKPQSFAEQAKRYSECPETAPQGGLMSQVEPGQLPPQLDEVFFAMEEKQLSKIIETPEGFHLLLCEKIHARETMSFEEAQPHILEKLQQRRRQIYQENWLKQLQPLEVSSSFSVSL